MRETLDLSLNRLHNLKRSLTETIDIVNSCIIRRKDLVEFRSPSELSDLEYSSKIDPDHYYQFRMFDKVICITRDKFLYRNGIKLNKTTEFHYHIACYGFVPKMILSSPEDKFIPKWKSDAFIYSNQDSFETISNDFLNCVLDFLSSEISFNYQLELF